MLLFFSIIFSINITTFADESEGQAVIVTNEEELKEAVADENMPTIIIGASNSFSKDSAGTTIVLSEPMIVTHDLTMRAADDNPIIIKVAGQFQHMMIYPEWDYNTVDFENIILDGAGMGGGIQCSGNITINNAIIQNCANVGIQCSGNITVNESTISKNGGSGINGSSMVNLTVKNSIISDNKSYSGGGISLSYFSKLTLNNSIIADNTADYGGGGIYLYYTNSTAEINDSIISGNTAEFGGGIYGYMPEDRVSITGCSIKNNAANIYGGGIFSYEYDLTVDKTSIFSQNKASGEYYLTNPDFIALHNENILTSHFSEPFTEYAYNNYDIGSHFMSIW